MKEARKIYREAGYSTPKVAELLGLSESYLSKLFREEVGYGEQTRRKIIAGAQELAELMESEKEVDAFVEVVRRNFLEGRGTV